MLVVLVGALASARFGVLLGKTLIFHDRIGMLGPDISHAA